MDLLNQALIAVKNGFTPSSIWIIWKVLWIYHESMHSIVEEACIVRNTLILKEILLVTKELEPDI